MRPGRWWDVDAIGLRDSERAAAEKFQLPSSIEVSSALWSVSLGFPTLRSDRDVDPTRFDPSTSPQADAERNAGILGAARPLRPGKGLRRACSRAPRR